MGTLRTSLFFAALLWAPHLEAADSTVVFNEIMYHPPDEVSEWVELHSQMAVDMDISGWSLGGAVRFTFGEGTILPGGGYLIVALLPELVEPDVVGAPVFGPFQGRLDNGNDRLELFNNSGRLMDTVRYRDSGDWPVAPDGSGASLAKIDPDSGSRGAEGWTWSAEVGGTPGRVNFLSPDAPPPAPQGLVSYWSFDEAGGTGRDPFGGNAGRLGSAVERVTGIVGSGAVSFDNSQNALIDVGAGSQNNFSTRDGIAIEALIQPLWSGEVDEQDHIFRKQDGTRRIVLAFQHDDFAADRDVAIDPVAQPVLSFGVNIDGTYSELDMPLDGQDGRPSLASLKDGEAHHVVATYDSDTGTKAIYVDGALAFSASFEPGSRLSSGGSSTAYIGNMAGRAHPFTGTIDEVAFWNRSLSAEEIGRHRENAREGKDYLQTADDEPTDAPIPVAFNEVSLIPADSWVELINHGAESVQLEGLVIAPSDGPGAPFVFAAGTLAPGGFLVLGPAELGFELGLGRLFLYSADRRGVIAAVALEDGLRGRSTAADGLGPWLRPVEPTPGAANRFELDDRVVINEIMYHQRPQLSSPGRFEEIPRIAVDSTWSYDQSGNDLGTAWREADFDDTGWPRGQALFFNETSALPAAKNTELELGILTYYFRLEFDFEGDPTQVDLSVRPLVDDGAIFYLNGEEFHRINMPEGAVDAATEASRSVGNGRFTDPFPMPGESLRAGPNLLAAEVHQVSANSNDVAFGAEIFEVKTLEAPKSYEESLEAWIELHNRSATVIDIGGWALDGGVDYLFEEGTVLAPGGYLVVAEDRELLEAIYPGVPIVGNLIGRLGNGGDRIRLLDTVGNPVDDVEYFDRGGWPRTADGFGSSLELRNPQADNSRPGSWAASAEHRKSRWKAYTYRDTGAQIVGPSNWNELVLGLFQAGEVLLDDISVIEDPDGAPKQLIQNGGFDRGEETWRFLGTHEESEVIADPADASNQVLHLIATGATEHMHNHVETTYVGNARLAAGRVYEISFRARWLSGSRQLHTRLYFNRAAQTTALEVPERTGTPGAENSTLEENIGPSLSGFGHSPIFPELDEEVTVSVTAQDPDGVKSSTLWWSVSSGDWQSTPMELSADGVHRGKVPGQTSTRALVQFYVEAEDSLGSKATFPPRGRRSGAIFQPRDTQADNQRVYTVRILMTPDDTAWLYQTTNVMSNAHLPATVIYREREVFYDAGVRMRGSERGRVDASRIAYHITFPPDQPFRGVHRTVSLDRSGGWASHVPFGSQDEILIKHIANHAGDIPSMYDDIVHIIAPRPQQTGKALLLMARFGDGYLDAQFANGSEGTTYTYELIYHPTSTTNGNPESLKRPSPDQVLGTDHRNLGDDKEDYRWLYLIENNVQRDDYSHLMEWTKVMGLSGASLDAAVDDVMDVDQWMRAFALYGLCGVGDTYLSGNFHNNMYYVRPTDNRVLVFPWDMDFSFVNGATSALWGTAHNLRRVIEIPRNTRLFYRHIHDIVETTYNDAYMSRWVSHYGELDNRNFGGFLNYIRQRSQFARGRVPRQIDFEITTNGGEEFDVDELSAEIEGNGWIDLEEIVVEGLEEPPPLAWRSPTRWRLVVPLLPGRNAIVLHASDASGSPVGSDEIAITSTAGAVFIRGDADLSRKVNIGDAISILFHLFRGRSLDCEDAGDVNDDGLIESNDAIQVIRYLFLDGPAPAPPFPGPGVDPQPADGLECERSLGN